MTEVFVEERLLECGICLEMLNETCKMLPCQHTYCKTCLENTRQNEGCLRCPQCRTVIDTDINNLPKNLVLLSLIEQVKKKPPPQPKNDEDELVKAMSISMEEFRKENAANLLLRHNEQLQTQLALENSKREALLQSEKEISDEYNELLHFQTAIEQSEEQELFRRRNQHLLSEKEKLECQLVLLKSELEANTARSSNNSDMASLFSWFAKNMDKISDDQRREAQKGLESLRRAVGTQFEDDSTLNQLQLLIDKMKKDDIKNDRNQNRPTTSNDNGDAAINDVMKNLNELQTMLREESKDKTTRNNQQRNFLYPVYPPPIPSLLEDQQMFHLRPRFYDPRMPSPQYPRYPSMSPSFQPPTNYLSKFGRGGSEATNFYSRGGNNGGHLRGGKNDGGHGRGGRNDGGHGRGRSRGSPSKSVFQKMGFDKLQNQRRESGDIPGSIILPDVRDYKKLDKIPDNNFGTKSESGNQKYGDKQTRDYRFPSSNPGIRGPLLLPDIRYYDKIHSKFHKDTETSDNTKCDDESLGSDVKGRHSNFENNNERTPRTPYRGKKPYRGRGKKTFHPRSKSTEKNNGDESDSSVSSLASCSSHLSTASTPSGPSNFRQNKPFRGNKYKQRNSDHHNPQNRFHENTDRKDVFNRNRNSNQKDDMKRLLYPSKQDALRKNIDLNKKFDTPVICLGKDVNKPVSQTVECLADVYEFEEKYQDCKVIRI